MTNQNHPWCRDVRRDEAVRAAEDAAEAERTPLPDHRDMPQAVADLRERVARLEAVTKLAPAANAGGEDKQEPVAWTFTYANGTTDGRFYNSRALADEACPDNGTVVPLYAAPQPPRGWLTRHERWRLGEMVAWLKGRAAEYRDTIHGGLCECYAADIEAILARPPQEPEPRGWLTEEMRDDLDEALEWLNCQTNVFAKRAAAAIATTLAREMPPKVKVPSQPAEFTLPAWNLCVSRWIAAIREAGGEVE